uniref:Pyridoxal-dependent decarboxylase domain-containing protein 1 n=1 Tax=Hucho hucho TaxID=62062 RepID=A0A4W5QBM9_9TELE
MSIWPLGDRPFLYSNLHKQNVKHKYAKHCVNHSSLCMNFIHLKYSQYNHYNTVYQHHVFVTSLPVRVLSPSRMQNVGEQGHMALLGHSLAAYISVLDRERLRKLITRIASDTTLWLCRLFRYESGSAYYHEDDREGLLKVCRLVINTRYEDYSTEGYTVLNSRQPVIYQSATCRPGLGQYLCSQLGLPLSSLCTVPCNTMFGSQHQMDIALLDKLIREDVETGKLPLLLIANAGTPGAGHTDKLGRLKELCEQYGMWLHIEGVNLATLALGEVSSPVTAATRSDSMTLTLGPWLGLPAVPAVTLYRHEDPALSLAAGLTSSQPVEKLRALPLWLSLQYLGHDGIVEKIRHAVELVSYAPGCVEPHLCVCLAFPVLQVEDELNSPVVVFRFSQETSAGEWLTLLFLFQHIFLNLPGTLIQLHPTYFRCNLCERLAQLVPASGVDIVELEDEGTCVRFTPLMTAAALGTQRCDVDLLVERLTELVPVLNCTLRLRLDFREEVYRHSEYTVIHSVLVSLVFGPEKDCIFIGMAMEDLDVAELVDTIAALGRDIEENGRLLENMTEVVRKGIQEAELQLQKDNQDKLMEEGVLRQIPLVSSVLNWFSPFQSTVKGRTFNLAAGSLDSTEPTYSMKAQTGGLASPETPTSSAKRLPGQRLFRREGAGGSDSHSETSSVGQAEDLSRERVPQPTTPTPPVPDEAVSVAPESPETPQVPAEPEPTQEKGEVGTQEGEEEERQPEGQEVPVEETGR